MPSNTFSKRMTKVRRALAPKSINTGVSISGPVAIHTGYNPELLSSVELLPLHIAAQRQSVTQRGFQNSKEGTKPALTRSPIEPAASTDVPKVEPCRDSIVSVSSEKSTQSSTHSWENLSKGSSIGFRTLSDISVGSSSSKSWERASISSSECGSWEHASVSSIPTSQQESWDENAICVEEISLWKEDAICEDEASEWKDVTIKEDDISLWIDEMLNELDSNASWAYDDGPSYHFTTSAAEFPEPITYTHPTGPCPFLETCGTCLIARSLPPQFPPNFAYAMKLITLEDANNRDDVKFRPEGFELKEQPPKAPKWEIKKNVDMSFIDIERIMAN